MSTEKLVEKVNEYGWTAFFRPRKRTVSLNGGRDMPEPEARERLKRCIYNHENGLTKQQIERAA